MKNAFIAAFAVIALAAAARAEDRAQQLPPIDAGTIWAQINNQHNPFPQPVPTTLDYCTLTEMKNNKCYFKCQSGAILTEPATKPDFSNGEPNGPCATMIIRPVPAGTPMNKSILPLRFEDFEGCSSVDNMFIMQPTMKDALAMLDTCMKTLSSTFNTKAKAASVRDNSIQINTGDNDQVLGMVKDSVKRHNGQFFGYPVTVKK